MPFTLVYSEAADETLNRLDIADEKKRAKVYKALGLMETNLRHPGLHTHKYEGYQGKNGEEVFEAYVENHTPGAYRIYWHYGPERGEITILAITPHP